MSNLKGNEYAEGLEHMSNKGIELDLRDVLATALMAQTYEQRTANLLAVYESVLCGTLNGAERLELENAILQRTGIRDA